MAVFGNEVSYANFSGIGATGLFAGKFELTEAGTVTNISAYARVSDAGTHTCRAGIYSDNAGNPDAFQVGSGDVNVSAAAWYDFAVDKALAAGWYWLTAFLYDGTCQLSYLAASGLDCFSGALVYPNWPAPFGAHTDGTLLMSIHADYTPEAGGVTVKKGSSLTNTMMQMINSKILYNTCNRWPKVWPRRF